eukprot:7073513-Pyramimonas_sp.AAC.1
MLVTLVQLTPRQSVTDNTIVLWALYLSGLHRLHALRQHGQLLDVLRAILLQARDDHIGDLYGDVFHGLRERAEQVR